MIWNGSWPTPVTRRSNEFVQNVSGTHLISRMAIRIVGSDSARTSGPVLKAGSGRQRRKSGISRTAYAYCALLQDIRHHRQGHPPDAKHFGPARVLTDDDDAPIHWRRGESIGGAGTCAGAVEEIPASWVFSAEKVDSCSGIDAAALVWSGTLSYPKGLVVL